VSIWASENALAVGQVACDDKSNEIDAIPELLRLVDITGAIVTIDAMGTQKEIVAQIGNHGGYYVLTLKGDQRTLHRSVIQYVDSGRQRLRSSGSQTLHHDANSTWSQGDPFLHPFAGS